jgi:hypothetical protein
MPSRFLVAHEIFGGHNFCNVSFFLIPSVESLNLPLLNAVKMFENIWSPWSYNILKSAFRFNMRNVAPDISIK